METNTTDLTADPFLPEPKRPQFLSVLCILTWILSGIMLISTANNILNKPSPEEQAEQIEKMREKLPEAADSMEATFQKMDETPAKVNTLISLIALALSSLGAAMMWQLKKTGFYVYLLGELLPYLGLVFVGTAAFDFMAIMFKMNVATIMGIAVGIMLLFDGIFITMYAANLKHMKK
ncbi:MAG: hypothetical protein IT236_12245 [Bacteroidia bacterium]|nr:hypothetical protein [Bacteroidia bacterium]